MSKMFITIKEDVKIKDCNGTTRVVTLKMKREAYIGDLYIYFKERAEDKNGYHLSDDTVLIKGVMAYLKKRGYKGPKFSRAEMGMQGDKLVILEPPEEFEIWADKKFGFIRKDM